MNSTTRRLVSSRTARALVEEALAHAGRNGWDMAAAVVDPAGHLVAFGRTDAVIVPAGEFAIDKAYTAGTLGKSTRDYFDRVAGSEALKLGYSNRPRLMVWGGGLPLFEDGVCIGGLGVSGALDHQDIECGETAIAAAGLRTG